MLLSIHKRKGVGCVWYCVCVMLCVCYIVCVLYSVCVILYVCDIVCVWYSVCVILCVILCVIYMCVSVCSEMIFRSLIPLPQPDIPQTSTDIGSLSFVQKYKHRPRSRFSEDDVMAGLKRFRNAIVDSQTKRCGVCVWYSSSFNLAPIHLVPII